MEKDTLGGQDMTYYVIKTHYTPTETNKDGFEHDYYRGKADFSLDTVHPLGDRRENKLWDSQYALEHAYTRLCDAKRSLKFHQKCNAQEETYGHWKVESSIMEVVR